MLVLRGRLQWITADRAWVLRSEKPAPESEYGIEKPASPEDPHVMSLLERLRRAGCSPWWVPQEGVQEFLNQGGEVVYDEDGRYLRTKRERSEWILLGRRGQGLAVGA